MLHLVNILYELIDSLQIVKSKLLNIVVACAVNIIRSILMLALFVHLLRMVEWHDLIPSPVDDKNRAVDVLYAVDVRKFVKG